MERSSKVTNFIPQNEVIQVKPINENEPQKQERLTEDPKEHSEQSGCASDVPKPSDSKNAELGVLTCFKIAKWYAKAYGATHVDNVE